MIKTFPLNIIRYTAEDMEIYHSTRSSGVYAAENQFQVSVTGNNKITIGKGLAWIKNTEFGGKSVAITEPVEVDIPVANGTFPRIDRVCLRFSKADNATGITVLSGSPASSPVAPAITRTEAIYDLCLYEITRPAGSTALSASHIKSTMLDSSLCGVMADSATKIPTEQLVEQAESLIEELRTEIDAVHGGTAWMLKSQYDSGGIGGDVFDYAYPSVQHYQGRELPFTWDQIKAKATAGDYAGIHIGDYKTVRVGSVDMQMVVAGIDTYTGVNGVGHHIDFISRHCYGVQLQYNATSTNAGTDTDSPFMASALWGELNNGVWHGLPPELARNIISKAAAGIWGGSGTSKAISIGRLWLPTEVEVFGYPAVGTIDGGGLNVQYPIFAGSIAFARKKIAFDSGQPASWWLYTPNASSSLSFVQVSSFSGLAFAMNANRAAYVPICFRIG